MSCQKPSQRPSDSVEVQADGFIDQKEYSKAIELLESELKAKAYVSEQQKESWVLTLASAYLGRAGLSIEQFYDLAESFQDQRRSGEPFLKVPFEKLVESLESQDSKEALSAALFFEKVYFVLELVDDLVLRFEKIPSVKNESVDDLNESLKILRSSNLGQKGSLLFKALIETVAIKSRWKFGEYKFDNPVQLTSQCDLNVEPFINQVKSFASDVKIVFEDISQVFPEESNKLSDFKRAIEDIQDLNSQELSSKSDQLSSGLFLLLLQFSPQTLQELRCI